MSLNLKAILNPQPTGQAEPVTSVAEETIEEFVTGLMRDMEQVQAASAQLDSEFFNMQEIDTGIANINMAAKTIKAHGMDAAFKSFISPTLECLGLDPDADVAQLVTSMEGIVGDAMQRVKSVIVSILKAIAEFFARSIDRSLRQQKKITALRAGGILSDASGIDVDKWKETNILSIDRDVFKNYVTGLQGLAKDLGNIDMAKAAAYTTNESLKKLGYVVEDGKLVNTVEWNVREDTAAKFKYEAQTVVNLADDVIGLLKEVDNLKKVEAGIQKDGKDALSKLDKKDTPEEEIRQFKDGLRMTAALLKLYVHQTSLLGNQIIIMAGKMKTA